MQSQCFQLHIPLQLANHECFWVELSISEQLLILPSPPSLVKSQADNVYSNSSLLSPPLVANKNLLFKSWSGWRGLGLVHAIQGNKFTAAAWYIEPTRGKTPGRLQGGESLCAGPLLADGPSPQPWPADTLTLAKTSFNDPPVEAHSYQHHSGYSINQMSLFSRSQEREPIRDSQPHAWMVQIL